MAWGRSLKRRARGAVAPAFFLLLIAYFLYNAAEGDHGLRSMRDRQQDLVNAKAELARSEADLAAWERRVAALRNNRLDADALDERSRAMLNLSDPADIIVPLKPSERFF